MVHLLVYALLVFFIQRSEYSRKIRSTPSPLAWRRNALLLLKNGSVNSLGIFYRLYFVHVWWEWRRLCLCNSMSRYYFKCCTSWNWELSDNQQRHLGKWNIISLITTMKNIDFIPGVKWLHINIVNTYSHYNTVMERQQFPITGPLLRDSIKHQWILYYMITVMRSFSYLSTVYQNKPLNRESSC